MSKMLFPHGPHTRTASSMLPRQLSTRLIVEVLLHQGMISRADLAKTTGLSKQTVSEVMTVLEQQGWVTPAGQTKGHIGRTALLYRLDASAACAVGVDMGGTKIAVAILDLTGEVIAETQQATHPDGGLAVLAQVETLVHGLLEQHQIPRHKMKALMLGLPGVVRPHTHRLAHLPNIPHLQDIDVYAELSQRFGLPIGLDNDANLAVQGENWRGAAQAVNSVALIALGTGIGMGLMLNGTLVKGHAGLAGEIGYIPWGQDVLSDEAHKFGALELELGSVGILRRYQQLSQQPVASVQALFERLGQDPHADTVLSDTAYGVALVVATTATTVDPELFVLGGSIGSRPEMLEGVRQHLRRFGFHTLKVASAQLGNRAGVLGAAGAALTHLYNQLFGVNDVPGAISIGKAPSTAIG